MIQLQFERGEVCPKVFCDLCGRSLDDESDGHVLYMESGPAAMAPQFVHSACDMMRPVEEQDKYHWMPMSDFMVYLLVNLRLPVHSDMSPRNL